MQKERINLLAVLTIGCLTTLFGTAMSQAGLSVAFKFGTIVFAFGALSIAYSVLKIAKQDSLIFGSPKKDTPQHLADKKWSARFYYVIGAAMAIITVAITGTITIYIVPGLALVVLGLVKRNVQIGVRVHKEYHIRLFDEAFQRAMAKH